MSTNGEIVKVGQFTPNPNRHQGFRFIDLESGIGYSLENLITDPQDPYWQAASLNAFHGGTIRAPSFVVPALTVVWKKGLIREAEAFVATIEQQPVEAETIKSRIAVGSLAVQLKG